MGWVDRAKSAYGGLVERTMPRRVVFHHVPKCGGTSVGRALRKRYVMSQATVNPESSFRAFEAFTGRSDREGMLVDVLDLREQMLLYLLYEDVRCISLHVRFSEVAWRQFRDRYKFVTILREPVSRFVSHYYWSYGREFAHARIEEKLGDFLETDRARRLGSSYVEYYCGLPRETDFSGEDAIAAAVHNLGRFDVIGRLDRLDRFEADLRKVLGARIRIGHENRMSRQFGEGRQEITPAMRDRIRQLCAPDIAVWRAVTAAGNDPADR
jgi:hypothetical protein